MPIPLTEPITIPAMNEENIELRWIQSITIIADGPTMESSAVITYRPMRNDSTLLPETRRIEVPELFRCCREVPQAAAVMSALLAAVIPIETWIAEQT